MQRFLYTLVALGLLAGAAPAFAAVDPDLGPEDVSERWARRLAGMHYTARVKFSMGDGSRRFTIRWDDKSRRERMLVRYEWPRERRGDSFLMLENLNRLNDYFYYSTVRDGVGVRRMDRIARGNPFAGGEFDYLHARVARHGHPQPTSLEITTLDGREVYLLTEEAKGMHFEKRRIWLDPETFVPLRGEYWRAGEKFLTAETERIDVIQGVATPVRIRFEYPLSEGTDSALWQVEGIDYERPILDSYFARPRR